MSQELEEKVARAIYEADDPWHVAWPWPNLNENQAGADGYRRAARAALAVVREAMDEKYLRLELAKRRFDNLYTIDDDGCFVWLGPIDKRDGYGRFYDGSGKTLSAYRFAWQYHCGPVPDGKVIDHICRNRACVNHTHLRLLGAGN